MIGTPPIFGVCVLIGSMLFSFPLMLQEQVYGQDICTTIVAKYAQNSGALGAKTYPSSTDCEVAFDGHTLYADYENGSIYQIYDPPAVMILEGTIMDKWTSLGGEQGVLGFPTEDQKNTLPSGGPGQSQVFQHGIILLKPGNVAKWLKIGEIRDFYAEHGWEQGQLGHPVSEPQTGASSGSEYQQFENGYIYFTPSKGGYITSDRDDSPTMVLPSITVDATDTNGAIVTYTVQVQDDYDPGISASCNYPSGFLFNIGTTTVTCTTADSINAPVVKQFTVTVKGNSGPAPQIPPANDPLPPVPGTAPHTLNALVKGKLVAVDVMSSSKITNFILDEKTKRLSFRAEGESGTMGTVEVSIGKILEGPYTVTVDDRVTTDFEVGNDASGIATITISYTHSVHSITIAGTNVIPEFQLIGILIVPGLVAAVLIARLSGRKSVPTFKAR
jgi:hypothetical protein